MSLQSNSLVHANNIELLTLKEFSWDEVHTNGEVDYKLANLSLSNFTFCIGDNAQGKTRFLRALLFLRELFSGRGKRISTNCKSQLTFQNSSSEEIIYILKINTLTDLTIYSEEIKKGEQTLFSSEQKILINEKTGERVDKFFVPDNVPILLSITDSDYRTINSIRSFFQRILFCETSIKSSKITYNLNANNVLVPNDFGTDLGNVLANWHTKYPERFELITTDFRECFEFVRQIEFIEHDVLGVKLIALLEKDIPKKIEQPLWAEGYTKTLLLLTLSNVKFELNGSEPKLLPPSMILVDEFENGLDYKTLHFLVEYFKSLEEETQIVVTSHSPLVCEFIPVNNWRVFKRVGSTVTARSPAEIDHNLEQSLDFFRRDRWDFYTKHLNPSLK